MHYGESFFSKNGLKTIEVQSKNIIPIGQRESLSEIDKLKLNKLYVSMIFFLYFLKFKNYLEICYYFIKLLFC